MVAGRPGIIENGGTNLEDRKKLSASNYYRWGRITKKMELHLSHSFYSKI